MPLERQATDALRALETLHAQPGLDRAPIGLWGFSQGAWAGPYAAAISQEVDFLVLVASPGVSPARQMRYGTAEQLRRRGFGQDALAELAELRAAYEDYLRCNRGRSPVEALIAKYAQRAWFKHAFVPRELPPPGSWVDMDFDPEPIFAQVGCPVLLFSVDQDEWVPVNDSIDTWRRSAVRAGNRDVTVVRLVGSGHAPDPDDSMYTDQLVRWVIAHTWPE